MHSEEKKITTEDDLKEYLDTPEEVEIKVNELVKMIRESKEFTIFTGAGISTASGIPDYRSCADTMLPVGAGSKETDENIQKARDEGNLKFEPKTPDETIECFKRAKPSLSHMSIAKLVQQNIVKNIISQNIDGLHVKSGVPLDRISELHGNYNLEECKSCGNKYFRDFTVRREQGYHNHETDRICDDPNCRWRLYDTIINFGEALN